MSIIKRIIKEPLLHFFVIGVVIFGLYSFSGNRQYQGDATNKIIRVSQGQINWLKSSWKAKYNREPTEVELEGLIAQYIREIVYYREAVQMGLDDDDTIVRRRMVQKLEFLTQDIAALVEPSEEQLKSYFK